MSETDDRKDHNKLTISGILSKDGSLFNYASGAVESSIAAAGSALRNAVESWQETLHRDSVDFEAEGLLEGADDPDARADLLRQLHASGVTLEDLRKAVKEDRLPLLPVEAVLRAESEHTLDELASSSDLEEADLARWISALGIGKPGSDAVFHDFAPEAAAALKELQDAGLSDEAIDEICRTAGRCVGNVAETVRDVFGDAFIEPGDTERDVGLRYAAAARRMLPVFEPLVRFTLTAQLLQVIRSDVVSRSERATGTLPEAHEVAVCFADLSQFTRASGRLSAQQLGELVRRFDELVHQNTPEPARHVKTVGDAAMIVSPEPEAVIEAAVKLIDAAEEMEEDFPQIHAGISMGKAVARDGDWHGHPVNMASRLADCAPPGEIYVSEAIHQTAEDRFEYAGERRLKGIGQAVPVFAFSPRG